MKAVLAVLAAAVTLVAVVLAAGATVVHDVNLRPTASIDHPPIRLLKPPETLTLISDVKKDGFYHVRTGRGEEGWVWAPNISVEPSAFSATVTTEAFGAAGRGSAPSENEPGGEAFDQPGCPPQGETKFTGNEKIDDEQRNLAKRHIPVGGTPVNLTLADFATLQADVNSIFSKDAERELISITPDRTKLKSPKLATAQAGVTVAEGDRVEIADYVNYVSDEGPETVNCAATDGTDIHINLGPNQTGVKDQHVGIVVEMIPQWPHPRPAGWNSEVLKKVMKAGAAVLAVGSLTLDNGHYVNKDPAVPPPRTGQPQRMSLWEVHPIVEFFVCDKSQCDPSNHGIWLTLTQWATAHPQ